MFRSFQSYVSGQRTINFDDEKSLYQNFIHMAKGDSRRLLSDSSAHLKTLLDTLELCKIEYTLHELAEIHPMHLKNESVKNITVKMKRDIAALQLAKMAMDHWVRQDKLRDTNGQMRYPFITHFKVAIENKQNTLHQLYSRIHKAKWHLKGDNDVYSSVHLWQTDQGLLKLKKHLISIELQSRFDYLCSEMNKSNDMDLFETKEIIFNL